MEIKEMRKTTAAPHLVWQTWQASNYWDLEKTSFKEGQKGRVDGGKKRGPAFTVSRIEEGKSFALTWKAPMVRFTMHHQINLTPTGTELIYSMQLEGLMAYPMRLLLGRKIRRTLQETLEAFVSHIER